MNTLLAKLMRLMVLLVCVCLCACTPRVVYQKVYIPTKCTISKPERPAESLGLLAYLKELLIYVERLEQDLDFCTKEKAEHKLKGGLKH